MSLTTDPNDPRLSHGTDAEPTPQSEAYLVLSEEERAKGFVRPLRLSYRHVGKRPKYPLRELTAQEKETWGDEGYVAFEAYPKSESPKVGRYWTQEDLDRMGGCGVVTSMNESIAATYARDPLFYGSTYCCGCQKHLSVGEFVWTADGSVVGS